MNDGETDASLRRKRGRPTPESSDEVNAQIEHAALRHFLLEGLERASIQRIAQDAGVSRQLIYQKYGSKRRLFEALMAAREASFFADVKIPAALGPTPPYEALLALAQHMAGHLLSDERVALARLMYGGLYRYPEIAAAEREARDRALDGVSQFLRRLTEREGISDIDTRNAARDFRSMINGLATPVILGLEQPPEPARREALVMEIVRNFVRGIGLDVDKLADERQAGFG